MISLCQKLGILAFLSQAIISNVDWVGGLLFSSAKTLLLAEQNDSQPFRTLIK